MTEHEWLTITNPAVLLAWAQGYVNVQSDYRRNCKISGRKLRLFACACVREEWCRLDARSQYAISMAEAYADGLVSAMVCELAAKGASDADDEFVMYRGSGDGSRRDWAASWAGDTRSHELQNALKVVFHLPPKVVFHLPPNEVVQCDLFRDIVGNPFRPVTIEPGWLAWHGGCISALAAEIYEQRAWDRLPILADALEEAGCSAGEVHEYKDGGTSYWWNDVFPDWPHLTPDRAAVHPLLAHLRGAGPHVRGCWVLDLLTGQC